MKKYIIGFILGALIFGSIAGAVAYDISASQIGFEPDDEEWEVDNLQDALNSLYSSSGKTKTTLLWTNENPTSSFASQTLELNLSAYDYVVLVVKVSTSLDYKARTNIILPVGEEYYDTSKLPVISTNASKNVRSVIARTTGVSISDATNANNAKNNQLIIPYKIYFLQT